MKVAEIWGIGMEVLPETAVIKCMPPLLLQILPILFRWLVSQLNVFF